MFGQKLKKLRSETGLTQRELAPKLGISKGALAMYETDKREPDFETLQIIADYFHVTTDYLLGHNPKIKMEVPYKIELSSGDFQHGDHYLMKLTEGITLLDKETLEIAKDLQNLDENDKKIVLAAIQTFINKQSST